MTDDQGYGDLACLGNPIVKTPNIDKLHAQSAHLTNFHVAPTCAPTRAGLMTGRYCNRTGIWHVMMGRSILRRDEVTMADVFAAAGYRTGIFGKWHLGDNYPCRPQERGFQEVLVHGGGGVGETPDYWGNDYFDDTYWHNGRPKKFPGYCTDVWFDAALDFIETNKDRPFFCYLPVNAPHNPFNVAKEYSDMYAGADVPSPEFYGMITNLDDNMARLADRLSELGLEENTILIFMTDNGSAGGVTLNRQGMITKGYNDGMRGKKVSPYDGGHRVPCFIRWPAGGLNSSRDIDRLTAHIDLLPTLIEMCGLEKPEEVTFDGSTLVPLLTGQAGDWPERTLVVDCQLLDNPKKWRNSAVMTDRWRLVKGEELYDIKVDPGQQADVAGQNREVVAKLRKAYEAWWDDVSERFDEYCEIVIGSEKENPSRLTSHDWHASTPLIPWSQENILNGMKSNGFWAVEVARDGTYEIALRRWPAEVDAPITGTIPGGRAIDATEARLTIADVDVTRPVPQDAAAVTFRVELKAGKTRLQTWFTDDKGASRGAYFVYVKRLDGTEE